MEPIFKTPKDGYYFFGYYDKSPFDIFSNKLLAQKASFIDREPTSDDQLEIGYFEWKSGGNFIYLTSTKAWNWQQGCMLQWLGPDFNTKTIYNDKVDGRFVSIVMDINTKEKKILPMAVYSMHPEGGAALCIDNERHYWFREGYNYPGIQNLSKKLPLDMADGIWLLNINKKNSEKIIHMADLLETYPLTNMHEATHYLEHLMFNPCGTRFSFLHRWKTLDGTIYGRLYTADINGDNVYLLNDSGRVTHSCWVNDSDLIAWSGLENPINRLRKYKKFTKYFLKPLLPLYHRFIKQGSKISKAVTGDSYVRFVDRTNVRERLYSELLTEDGHPSFSATNKVQMISDTYEDINHKRHLFLFNIDTGNKVDIASLNSSCASDKTTYRCDLHPKWSFDGKFISVDTTNEGGRQVCIYSNPSVHYKYYK